MKLPFTIEEFFQLFGRFNTGTFPMQVIFYLLILFALYLLYRKTDYSKVISVILAFFWLWMGIVYHLVYFSSINPAAYIFGSLFIIQGVAFLYTGLKQNLVFGYRNELSGAAGWLLIIYGIVIYPLLGFLAGHHYPYAPEISAPCPTTIFTFGILLFTSKISKWLLVIPSVWAIIGFSAAASLNVPQDYGLIFAAVISVSLIVYRNAKLKINFNKA